jgi:hypothetical protein
MMRMYTLVFSMKEAEEEEEEEEEKGHASSRD